VNRNFLLFAGLAYYPGGGWDDLIGMFDNIDDAKQSFDKIKAENDWAEIVDLSTMARLDWDQAKGIWQR